MKIITRVVKNLQEGHLPGSIEWPEGWPVPQEGQIVHLNIGEVLRVRHVNYYPQGDNEGTNEPFIYVVMWPV